MTDYLCPVTGRQTTTKEGSTRPPRGWRKTPEGEIVSPDGWRQLFSARSIVLPVAGPIGVLVGKSIEEGSWKDLRADLAASWQRSTLLSNWATRELAKADVVRAPGMEKLPPFPRIYLYGLAKEAGLLGPDSQSAAMILRNAEQYYSSDRYQTVWLGKRSLRHYRYPTPYPIPEQGWTALWHRPRENSDPIPAISTRINGRRWLLRLRGGREFARQMAAFRAVLEQKAIPGALALYERRTNGGDHRSESSPSSRLFVKFAVHVPKQGPRDRSGILVVTTGPDALLSAMVEGRETPWRDHFDHLKRHLAEHRRKMASLSDDRKAERRRPKSEMRDMNEAGESWARKMRHRLDSAIHEASAHLVGFADRSRVAKVVYDDSDRSFAPMFPWAELSAKIAYKLDALGVEFQARGPEIPDDSKPLEKEERVSRE